MLEYSIKILMGERLKYYGIILALSFGSFIITQQAGIFIGLMSRTYGFIADTSQPDIWVMNRNVQYVDDIKPLKDTDVFRVRGAKGVNWAVPLYKGKIKTKLSDGRFKICDFIGIDDSTLIGGPPTFIEGKIEDLRKVDAIIVNQVAALDKLAMHKEDGTIQPLQVGQVIELNDRRAVVAGICKVTRTFQSHPIIYTTYARALSFSPPERKMLSFILVQTKPGFSVKEVCKNIRDTTGLAAYSSKEFEDLTVDYFLNNTGIPLNFGVAVFLGFIIGTVISGQTFYNFILDNVRYLAVFKAMGADNRLLVKMTLLQIAWVGFLGWGIGIGGASLFGFLFRNSDLSFVLPWQLFYLSGFAMFFICSLSSLISLRKIAKVEPAVVFK